MKCDDCGRDGAKEHLLTGGEVCWNCHVSHVLYVIGIASVVTLAIACMRTCGLLVGGGS